MRNEVTRELIPLFINLSFYVAVEKQGFSYHYTYNSEAGINLRFGKMVIS